MKRIVSFCLIICALIVVGCKDKSITSFYSIGCMDFSGELTSDWTGFQHYMDSLTVYNENVSFTNKTIEENEQQAKAFFDEQYNKIKADEACAFIAPGDCVVYGIGSSIDSVSFDVLKGVRIYADRIEPYVR